MGKRKSRKYTSLKDHSASVMNSLGFVPAELWLSCSGRYNLSRCDASIHVKLE